MSRFHPSGHLSVTEIFNLPPICPSVCLSSCLPCCLPCCLPICPPNYPPNYPLYSPLRGAMRIRDKNLPRCLCSPPLTPTAPRPPCSPRPAPESSGPWQPRTSHRFVPLTLTIIHVLLIAGGPHFWGKSSCYPRSRSLVEPLQLSHLFCSLPFSAADGATSS
jgi:hypothetical protein